LLFCTLLVLGWGSASCGRRETAHPRVPSGTPIVLISIDTLRADRLPAYGYDAVSTPAIDALRADSILYRWAFTQVPLTLPAHASLLTGLYPPGHGVRDNAGYRLKSESLPYLPRILKQEGYRTGGAISAFVLRGTAGLDSGFDFYDDRLLVSSRALLSDLQRNGFATWEVAREWLRSVSVEPFFLFFHIYEPHAPHAPPEPYASRYRSPYDGEVAVSDAIIAELLDELRRLDLYDRSVILLLSDHGEGLNDHGDYEHGLLLYREVLQVPLLLKLPHSQLGGVTEERPVALIDILPTILELLEIEGPSGLPGRSLFDEGDDGATRAIFAETFFPRFHFSWSQLFSVIVHPFHYIEGPDPELYNLEQDPAQRRNILRDERRALAEARQLLREYDQTFVVPALEDEDTRARLAALGYLGSTVATRAGDLPDPKTQLPLLEDLKVAFEDYAQQRYAEAEAGFRAVLVQQPQLIDAWEQLGHSLMALGRPEEALEAFETAMELSGGAPHIAGALAGALLQLGRHDEARDIAELAVDGHEQSRNVLAQIAIRLGDVEAAEAIVTEAIERRGTRLGPLMSLAELRFVQQRFDEALTVTDEVLAEFGERTDVDSISGLYHLRGSIFAHRRDLEASVGAFQREIELFPGSLDAYRSLALVQTMQGEAAAGRATLELMLERNVTPQASAMAVRAFQQLGNSATASRLLSEARQKWPDSPALRELG